MPNLIVLAIPVFLALIALEIVIARVQERELYRLADAVTDLSCGMTEQLVQVFLKTVLFAAYLAVYGRLRIWDLPATSLWVWAVALLGFDFLYYWFHRLSHEVNAFWAAHVVHHQSEDYNLAVALRQGTFQSSFSWVFYLPLALAGVPPAVFLAVSSLDTLYQFWVHTQVVGRLGPLEAVLNTPSHHRVHHGRNPRYIDRNHGGILIVWDRLFGTFEPEGETCVYGITTPLRSWNPLWANTHYWVELFGLARRTTGWADRVRVFLKPPGWRPAELGGYQPAPPIPAGHRSWDAPRSRAVTGFAFVQFVAILAATSYVLFRQDTMSTSARATAVVLLILGLAMVGWLLEGLGKDSPAGG